MKKHRFDRKDDELWTRIFYIRCAAALILFLSALALRTFGDKAFYDALLYKLGDGPAIDEVVETFGKTPLESQAFVYLWKNAVEEPVINIFSPAP